VVDEQRELVRRLRVGVFILAGLVALVGMVYLLGARARLFEPRYTIHAEFTEVGGLTDGATVRLAGVQIGRVTGVRLPAEPGGRVQVDLTIAKQFADRVRKDSVARIETQGLLGDKLVELTVGTAQAPAAAEGDLIASREPFDIGQVMSESAQIVRSVGALAESLQVTAQTLNQSRLIEDAAGAVASARRLTDQVGRDVSATTTVAREAAEGLARVVGRLEKGPGLAHTLLYEEPVALQRINALIASTQAVLERVQRGEGAVGVLTSAESSAAARRLVAAMDRLGRLAEQRGADDGLLPALLFDPRYRGVLDDLRLVTRNFRDVSERLAGGRGTLGSLLKDEPGDAGLAQASRDFQAAVANLREITDKVNDGEGTVGALIADPTVYERLVSILDGAQRSRLLRGLLRGLGRDEAEKGQ
jgi:phospholipid/cholesterol/gamma-HCH transport system substrate-binding protein